MAAIMDCRLCLEKKKHLVEINNEIRETFFSITQMKVSGKELVWNFRHKVFFWWHQKSSLLAFHLGSFCFTSNQNQKYIKKVSALVCVRSPMMRFSILTYLKGIKPNPSFHIHFFSFRSFFLYTHYLSAQSRQWLCESVFSDLFGFVLCSLCSLCFFFLCTHTLFVPSHTLFWDFHSVLELLLLFFVVVAATFMALRVVFSVECGKKEKDWLFRRVSFCILFWAFSGFLNLLFRLNYLNGSDEGN